MTGFSGDTEVKARLARVEAMLRSVCDAEEFPWFVSDEATVYDVCSLVAEDIIDRLSCVYGEVAEGIDLQLPIWKLVDHLSPE